MGCKTQMGMAPTRWPYILEEQIVSRILLVSFFGHKHSIYCSQKNITERERTNYIISLLFLNSYPSTSYYT